MIKVVGVKFKSAGKVYYFDPLEFDINKGDSVIVETARGLEFGAVTVGVTMVEDKDVIQPLKQVVRIATEEDVKVNDDNQAKKADALKICQEKVKKHNLEMKLIDVEYTFDNNKIVFYFTSDGRVDFRELVKDLASVFKMRIELRQIGVRDEAKMLDGIGNCGRSLCCSNWLSDFQPVSIKMAKTQGLSLNPTKISGICGRLMCCLKYENDVYLEMKKGMPDTGEIVGTSSGRALVVESNILENKIKARLLVEGERDKYDKQKLGNEVFEFTKDEIKRFAKGNKNQKKNNEEIPDEIKALLKE